MAVNTSALLEHIEFRGVSRAWRRTLSSGGARQARSHLRFMRAGRSVPSPARRVLPAEPAEPFVVWLLEQAGLDAQHYRPEPLNRRVSACLRSLRAPSIAKAREKLERSPDLLPVALDAVLLGVTDFFRDPSVFESLKSMLPGLAARVERLRIWSAACSDGQELYSVAFLLTELGLASQSELLGTDCRSDAVACARAGCYPQAILQGIAPCWDGRGFDAHAQRPGFVCVNQDIRASLRWKTENLLDRVEPGPWDIILWRNHAIYLESTSATALWHRLSQQLRTGGLLIAGRAERPVRGLPLERIASCIYRKV